MNTTKIVLEDMSDIERIRNKYKHQSSSHAFETLYIWKEELGLTLYIEEDMFAVKCNTKGSNTWFFPCGNPTAIIDFIENIDKEHLNFCYMRIEDVKLVEDNFSGLFEIVEKDDDHEYLYSCEEWNSLKGTAFAGIRNHINRACRDNELRVEPISDDNIEDVRKIIKELNKEGIANGNNADNFAAVILMKNYKALNVHGIVVYNCDNILAVVAGFPLSEDCFDMCLAKQTERLSGLSVYAKYQLVKSLPEQYLYFNAEEDLGIEGLRTMKKQMQPIGQIKMYDANFV